LDYGKWNAFFSKSTYFYRTAVIDRGIATLVLAQISRSQRFAWGYCIQKRKFHLLFPPGYQHPTEFVVYPIAVFMEEIWGVIR